MRKSKKVQSSDEFILEVVKKALTKVTILDPVVVKKVASKLEDTLLKVIADNFNVNNLSKNKRRK